MTHIKEQLIIVCNRDTKVSNHSLYPESFLLMFVCLVNVPFLLYSSILELVTLLLKCFVTLRMKRAHSHLTNRDCFNLVDVSRYSVNIKCFADVGYAGRNYHRQ